jgi:hypothetical protein
MECGNLASNFGANCIASVGAIFVLAFVGPSTGWPQS